jgi:hypothetical protein
MSRWHQKLHGMSNTAPTASAVQNVHNAQNKTMPEVFEHIEHSERGAGNHTDILDSYRERIAIAEIDGGLSHYEAEIAAFRDVFLEFVTLCHPTIRAAFDAIIQQSQIY